MRETTLDKKIESMISPIRITSRAKMKSELIARRVKAICSSLSLPTYEIGFLMLATKEEAKKNRPLISDVYIAHDQEAYPDYCIISGDGLITSMRDIKNNLRMRVVGWGHSHGDISTFFSKRDRKTFNYFLEDNKMFLDVEMQETEKEDDVRFVKHKGKTYLQVEPNKQKMVRSSFFDKFDLKKVKNHPLTVMSYGSAEVQYTYGMVFNADNDRPFTVIGYSKGNGITLIENVPFEEIEEEQVPCIKTEDIDQQIKSRVNQIRERIIVTRDKNLVKKKGIPAGIFNRERTLYVEEDKFAKTNSHKKKQLDFFNSTYDSIYKRIHEATNIVSHNFNNIKGVNSFNPIEEVYGVICDAQTVIMSDKDHRNKQTSILDTRFNELLDVLVPKKKYIDDVHDLINGRISNNVFPGWVIGIKKLEQKRDVCESMLNLIKTYEREYYNNGCGGRCEWVT